MEPTKDEFFSSFDAQNFPYKLSALACVVIWFWLWTENYFGTWFAYCLGNERCNSIPELLVQLSRNGLLDLILGIMAIIIVYMTVFRIRSVSSEQCCRAWEGVKRGEQIKGTPDEVNKVLQEIKDDMERSLTEMGVR